MTTFKLARKSITNEWVVVVRVDGKRCEDRCYYTDDKQDAIDTMAHMQRECYAVEVSDDLALAIAQPWHAVSYHETAGEADTAYAQVRDAHKYAHIVCPS